VVRTDTGSGKTEDAFIDIFSSLLKRSVGVYLVPHKRLLIDKQRRLEQFFTTYSESGEPQPLAHIVTISGEMKPAAEELQKHSRHLIIVATYEAFRAFYFEAQSRKYFHQRRWVGAVVVDESHTVYDQERGLRLETLIHKLKQEQDPQFCLLSASVTQRQAEWWSKRLGAELIYEPPRRVFNYEELVIRLDKSFEGISQDMDVQTVRSEGKYTQLERKKIDKVCERVKERLLAYKGKDQRILIFCYARWLAGEIAEAIRGRVNDETLGVWCWCEAIHAGWTLEDQDHVFQEFASRPSHNKVLVSSPLLETGIDVPDIDLIIVVDPELYPVTSLEQMCGRLRKKKGKDKAHELELNKDRKIIFVVTEEFRQRIERKFVFSEARTQILRFNLELDLWVYPNVEYTRLSLELLFRRVITKKQLLQRLRGLSYHPKYQERVWWSELIPFLFSLSNFFLQLGGNSSARIAPSGISQTDLYKLLQTLMKWCDWLSGRSIDIIFKDIYLTRLLEELERLKLVRKSGNRGGKFALTLVGDAVVETGVDFSAALEMLNYVGENASWSQRFIAKLVADRAALEYASRPERFEKRRVAIEEFLAHYKNNDLVNNFEYRKKHEIDAGDERKFRQTALWYSISLSVIYSAFLLQQAPLKARTRSYYARESTQLPGPQLFYQQATCFQSPDERTYRQKPPSYPRMGGKAPSDVTKQIEKVLRRRGNTGATIREIHLDQPTLSPAKIGTALDGSLVSAVFKDLEQTGLPHRAPYRYWLLKYKRSRTRKSFCSACAHFQAKKGRFGDPPNQTHCKQGNPCESGWHDTCEQFGSLKKGDFYIYHRQHFQTAEGGLVRCPHCRHYGTVQIPTFEVASICRNCKILLKQVQSGVFHGRVVPNIFQLLEGRITDLSTTPWITIKKYTKKIYLKRWETLHVEDPLKTKVAFLQIEGRKESAPFRGRSDKYFFDEVEVVYLSDKTAKITPPNGRQILEAHGIQVEKVKPPKMSQVTLQNLLREILLTLQGNSALKIAAKASTAKILTSLHYSRCLSRLLPDDQRRVLTESLYQQLDQLMQIRFLFEGQEEKAVRTKNPWSYINLLRSREGIAEKAAWTLLKAALPARFQFLSRKVQRAVRSDLHSGSKARDPYNAALNSLFWKLQGEAMKALEVGGFSRYYPGVGFLHRRHRKPPVIEHEKNRALIFDFMDSYRPPFRYYLLWAFQTKNARPRVEDPLERWCLENRFSETKDFEVSEDMWGEPVYTLSKSGEAKVEALFWRVCSCTFEYRGQVRPLWDIMRQEAKSLADDLLSFFRPAKTYSPFKVLVRGGEISAFWTTLTYIFSKSEAPEEAESGAEVVEEAPTEASPDGQQEEQQEDQGPLPSPTSLYTDRYKNVIIITHVDRDGFRSALLQLIKHYYWNRPNRGSVQIYIATPTSLEFVLEHTVTPLLWDTRNSYNRIIVSDFDMDIFLEDKKFFENLRHDYLQVVKGDASRLDFHWYDHHLLNPATSAQLDQYREPFGIQFHHNKTMNTYQIIVSEIEAEQRFYARILKSQPIIGALGLLSLFLRLIQIVQYQKKSYLRKQMAGLHLLTPKGEFDAQNLGEYLRIFSRLLLSQYGRVSSTCDPQLNFKEEIVGQVQKFCDVLDFAGQLGEPPKSRRPRNPATDRKRCDPWIFYKRREQKENIVRLQKWGAWFVEYTSGMQERPQKSWINFFKQVLSEGEPPPLERKPPEDPENILHSSAILATKNDIPMGVHIFNRWFNVDQTDQLLRQIYDFVPPINFFYWADQTVSLWASAGLDLSGYFAYFDVYMHESAGRIRDLQEKLFQIGEIPILTYLYSSRTLKECTSWGCQLEVTNKPADFSRGEIPIIPEDTRPLYEILGELIYPQHLDRVSLKLPLPEEKPFVLYPGEVTLLYSKILPEDENVASNFLHYLLCIYFQQCTSEGSREQQYEVLFIKTNVGGQQLQDARLLAQGLSQSQLQKVLKTAPLDWPTLKTFIERYLGQIIQTTGTNLIVLWHPFELIWKHLKTLDKYTRWKQYSKASTYLVGALQAIASKTGTHIILLMNKVYRDTENPYLHWETRLRLRQWLYMKWTGSSFECLVRERQGGATRVESAKFSVAPLPLMDQYQVLETVTGFPRGINRAIPPQLIPKISELQPQVMQIVAPPNEKAEEEREEVWGDDEEEPEVEVAVTADLGHLDPNDAARLSEPATLRTTAYGLTFLTWRFRTDKPEVKNLLALLYNNTQERDFDLVLWANQDYDIYSEDHLLDLFETHFGAAPCPERSLLGQAVCFTHDSPGVYPFEQFLKNLELLFIDFRQLSTFLKQIRDGLNAAELGCKTTAIPHLNAEVMADKFESLFLRLLPLFGAFPPFPPWDISANWEHFLRELGQLVPWDQAQTITEVLLEKLQRYHTEQRRVGRLDTDKLGDSLKTALEAPIITEKPKVRPRTAILPVLNLEEYHQELPELASVDALPTPMAPMFLSLRFVLDQYVSREKLAEFRENLLLTRLFDICLYSEDRQKQRKYHVFSAAVDLSCLQEFGGVGSQTNMYFQYGENPRVTSFNDFFEQFKTLDSSEFPFLGWKPFRTFLALTIDVMKEFDAQEGGAEPVSNPCPYTQADILQLREEILPILTHAQPTLEELITWSEIIQELRTYFDWQKIWDITESILGGIDFVKHNSAEKDETEEKAEIEDVVIDGLKRGLPPRNRH